MFLRGCLPFVDIEVVELDPLVAELANKYFGFSVDGQLKVGCCTLRIREFIIRL